MENLDIIKMLNDLIYQAECEMAAMIGAKFYKSEVGFTQNQLYTLGGREDSVFTLTLKKDSASYQKYGAMITVCFVYSLKERKALEDNVDALNEKNYANAKLLVPNHKADADELLREGVNPADIVSMTVLPSMEENNTFPSKEKRTPKVLEIPFEAEGGGRDIDWVYGFLERLKGDGVGLMPEDEAMYLAYKLIQDKNNLTEEEKRTIFNDAGQICNNAVAYYYLNWKKDTGFLSDEQKRTLKTLELNQSFERLALVDQKLKDMGLNVDKFVKKHPKQFDFLMKKIIDFRDVSFYTTGKFPLYMNFESFLHIYFRHSEELNISSQFADRDKFQLEEKDIMIVIDIIMRELNKEYQKYKEIHPDGRFYRRGEKAFYYNGDYYNVDVNPDGSISTFYKGTGEKKKTQ